jgi:serine protease Do
MLDYKFLHGASNVTWFWENQFKRGDIEMKRIFFVVPLVLVVFVAVAHAQASSTSWIGVSIRDGGERGVSVGSVEDDSPAQAAGLRVGDVIIEFNGLPVMGAVQFTRLVRETPVGRSVDVTVDRGGSEQAFRLTTDERKQSSGDFRFVIPDDLPELSGLGDRIRAAVPRIDVFASVGRLGIRANRLTDQLREYFGVQAGLGILVASVAPDSAAEEAGLRAGDVIIQFDGQDVDSPGDLRRRTTRGQDSVALKIIRDRGEQDLTIAVDSSRRR